MTHPPAGPDTPTPPPGPKGTDPIGDDGMLPTPKPKPAITLTAAQYQVTAKVWGLPVAHAIRSQFGWHVPLRFRRVGTREIPAWTSVDTREQAALVLTALAQKTLADSALSPSV